MTQFGVEGQCGEGRKTFLADGIGHEGEHCLLAGVVPRHEHHRSGGVGAAVNPR
jgi:hypothetical protein